MRLGLGMMDGLRATMAGLDCAPMADRTMQASPNSCARHITEFRLRGELLRVFTYDI